MPDTLIVAKQWSQTTSLGTGSAPFVGDSTHGGGTDWTDLGTTTGFPLYNQSGGKLLFAQVTAAENKPTRNSMTFRGTGASFQNGEVFSGGSNAPMGVAARIATSGAGWSAFIYGGSIFVWAFSNASGTLTARYTVSTAVTATMTGDCVIALRLTQSGNVVTPVVKIYTNVNLATFDPASPGTPAQTYTPATFDATSYADLRTAGYWGVGDYAGHNASTHFWAYLAGTELTAGSASATLVGQTAIKLTFTGATGGGATKTYSLWRRLSGVGSYAQVATGLSVGSIYDTGLTRGTAYDWQIRVNDGTTTVSYAPVTATTTLDAVGVIGDSNLDPAFGVSETSKAPYLTSQLLGTAGVTTLFANNARATTDSAYWASSGNYTSVITELATMGIKKLIIMLGTNDSKTGTARTKAAYKANLGTLESAYLAAVPDGTVLYSVPASLDPALASSQWNSGSLTLLAAYAAAMRERANGTNVLVLDGPLGSSFQEGSAAHLATWVGGDGVHWTTTGHSQLANTYWFPAWSTLYLPTYSSVTITNGATAEVSGEDTFQLAATVQGTNNPSQTVTWSIVSGGGSVDEDGLFTAPGAGQTDKTTVVKATAADGTTYDTISITTPAAGSGGGEPDTTAPTVLVAYVPASGETVEVYFSESVTGTDGFVLSEGGTARSATWNLVDGWHLRGTLSGDPIAPGAVLTLDYTPGTVEDASGNALETIADLAVGNYTFGETIMYNGPYSVILHGAPVNSPVNLFVGEAHSLSLTIVDANAAAVNLTDFTTTVSTTKDGVFISTDVTATKDTEVTGRLHYPLQAADTALARKLTLTIKLDGGEGDIHIAGPLTLLVRDR